ncbi:MAG TPA: elongation factor P maturation arginine rhamnosyltransferase EarP, partial [Rhodocyclaceae bacterium]|nr:elongation factor P maturation arginine rhamnosyltransferase EarP [Rhodocyclaceae bacterium]
LSLCTINFVRGEDSFVRAQWAAHPLVWQIYPQDADAHQIKLAAFLDLYCGGLSPSAASACRAFWQAWNSTSTSAAAVVWPAFCDTLPELSPHAAAWAGHLSEQPDLAGQLVGFCQNLL